MSEGPVHNEGGIVIVTDTSLNGVADGSDKRIISYEGPEPAAECLESAANVASSVDVPDQFKEAVRIVEKLLTPPEPMKDLMFRHRVATLERVPTAALSTLFGNRYHLEMPGGEVGVT